MTDDRDELEALASIAGLEDHRHKFLPLRDAAGAQTLTCRCGAVIRDGVVLRPAGHGVEIVELVADDYAADWPPYLVWGTARVRRGEKIEEIEDVALPPALVHANTEYAAQSCYKASVARPEGTAYIVVESRAPEQQDRRTPEERRRAFTVIRGEGS